MYTLYKLSRTVLRYITNKITRAKWDMYGLLSVTKTWIISAIAEMQSIFIAKNLI
jgi:hypothetical protein